MPAPAYSSYGTIIVGTNTITIPAITSGQSIVLMCSTPNSLGTGNLSISGAGATWQTIAESGAPLLVSFIGTSPTVGATSVTLTAHNSNVGVGSYIVTVWGLTQFSTAVPNYAWNNGQVNGVSFVTPPLVLASGATTVISGVTSYDPFAGATPPTWSVGGPDNLIEYQVATSGSRPVWMSWVDPSSLTVYTSPYSDNSSTGVAGIILFAVPVGNPIVMVI